jgi:CTP:molybdopterin cytidylyltransferase MocA
VPSIREIGICTGDRELVAALDALSRRAGIRAEITLFPSASSPAASVGAYIDELRPGDIALVTTADHPLLTPEMVARFLEVALERDADVVVGVVSETVYRARFPSGPRTFIRLADDAFSGANLFLVRAPDAASVARFWVRLEAVRKRPWRLVSHFGPSVLLRFVLRRLTVAEAEYEVSRRVGARVALVSLPFAEAALDVDRPSDLEAVERTLADAALEKPEGAR